MKSKEIGEDEEKSKEKAKFHILPIPLEKTVSCGGGTSKGPRAILKASNELERFTGKSEPCLSGIFTHPFLNCNFPIKNVMLNIEKTTKEICKQNKIPVILGGEHSITFGAVNGVFKGLNFSKHEEIGIIQIDAHADLRKNYENQFYSHASVMYLLSKSKYKVAQFGVRALSKEEVKNRNIFEIFYFDVEDIKNNKVEITSQNHGFEVTRNNLPSKIEITHKSLFDSSIEGIKLKNKPVFSVQYHPESNPGPQDSHYLFNNFIMEVKKYAKKKRH